MFFKPYYLGCLSHASYLVGGNNGKAVVIDPRRDIDEYLHDAQEAGYQITHVIETHLHADFVSGHLELAKRAGATIVLGSLSDALFRFQPVKDGDILELGDVRLLFLETPGHTPEGISIVLNVENEVAPRMVFTGDTLFIGDVGRPDLVGSKGYTAEQMAERMFLSLRDKILALPDTTEVWPAHGAGSSCGRALSDERVSTIGREKYSSPALKPILANDKAGFIAYATSGLNDAPTYFFHDAMQNKMGAKSMEQIFASAKALKPAEFEALTEEGVLALDTRSTGAFAECHVQNATHIQLEGRFAPWVGEIINPISPIAIVAEAGRESEAITRLARVGYENILGWLEGGMESWSLAGGETQSFTLTKPEAFLSNIQQHDVLPILDVRSSEEYSVSHPLHALNIPITDLEQRLDEVPNDVLHILCGTGYRASIAASILQRRGWHELSVVEGGWSACLAHSTKEVAHATA